MNEENVLEKYDKGLNRFLIGCVILGGIILVVAVILSVIFRGSKSEKIETIKVNISDNKYSLNDCEEDIKVYKIDEYEDFLKDYNDNNLPDIYITEFLFDGAGMYKTYDIDDFVKKGNDMEVDTLSTKVYNVNATANFEFTGEVTGGMIAVNTNDLNNDISIILNDVKIDTDSKKIPAIYVYNKNINYTDHKVTISALKDTKNYIEGGKFKKVSLIPSDDLDNYSNKYSGDVATWYSSYSNYYGVYTKDEIEKVLFAKITADNEDLKDGDPYYFYKGAGAISSDIDLYFEGEGYLEVTSKNKEGIETKGNLTFSGGVGDYVIYAQDDCLNTTTASNDKDVRNTLTIDVNSLYAVVSTEADEGDAIDSNGELIINNGLIVAIAKTGQDAGLDSSSGTYINGGTVLATGDMYDEIKSDSKQRFIVLSFANQVAVDSIVTMLDSDDNAVFAYKTDRTYTNLIYSSKDLDEKTYYLYEEGIISGVSFDGYYINIESYEKGTQLGYSSTGSSMGMQPGNMENGEVPEMPNSGERPEMPEQWNNGNMPQRPDDGNNQMPQNNMPNIPYGNGNADTANKDFTLSGIANLFSGVAVYTE